MNTLDKIKSLLDKRGWSIYRLAKNADMSQSTLANLFNRNYEPTIATLEAICKGFGITMSEFFASDGDSVVLTAQQKEMLDNWSKLDENQQRILLELIKSM